MELKDIIIKINELLEDKKYYYIVTPTYTIPGHYYNKDIHAYTPEGDIVKEEPEEISGLYTWDELLTVLDNNLLLTTDVPDVAPDKIVKEGKHKVLLEYDKEDEVEYEDETGYEMRYYNYHIQICEK